MFTDIGKEAPNNSQGGGGGHSTNAPPYHDDCEEVLHCYTHIIEPIDKSATSQQPQQIQTRDKDRTKSPQWKDHQPFSNITLHPPPNASRELLNAQTEMVRRLEKMTLDNPSFHQDDETDPGNALDKFDFTLNISDDVVKDDGKEDILKVTSAERAASFEQIRNNSNNYKKSSRMSLTASRKRSSGAYCLLTQDEWCDDAETRNKH